MVAEFRRRRDAFCAGLNGLPGFRCALPGGAFYAFPNVQGTGIGSKELAGRLLQEAGSPVWMAAPSAPMATGISVSATSTPTRT